MILFWGDSYYPGGGAKDESRFVETEAEAVDYLTGPDRPESWDWAHLAKPEGDRLVIVRDFSRQTDERFERKLKTPRHSWRLVKQEETE